MSFSIETSHYDILSSGVVIIPPSENLIFHIENLKIVVSFVKSSDDGRMNDFSINLRNEGDGQYLSLEFTNVRDMTFGSLQQPMIEIGTLGGRNLFLSFSVVTMNTGVEKSQIFHYTWLLKKAEAETQSEGGGYHE